MRGPCLVAAVDRVSIFAGGRWAPRLVWFSLSCSGCLMARLEASAADVAKCERLARERGAVYCVVAIDDGESRVKRVVRESYTFGDEFAAFDGEILYVSGC